MQDTHAPAHAPLSPSSPAPVVDWAAAKAESEEKERKEEEDKGVAARVQEVGDLAARLTAFYWEVNKGMVGRVREIVGEFASPGGEERLNAELRRKYGKDLSSVAAVESVMCQRTDALAQSVELQVAAAGTVVQEAEEEESKEEKEVREALAQLRGMGFEEEGRLRALLQAHANSLEAVLNALLQ